MLAESAPPLSQIENVGATGLTAAVPASLRPAAKRARDLLHADVPFKTKRSRTRIARLLARLPVGSIALNVGAGGIDYGPNVINVDVDAFPGVHVVAVGEALPFASESVDAVVFEGVLNVLADCTAALDEAYRVLKPGGAIIVDAPFMQGYNPSPDDHRRFTRSGLVAELSRHGFASTGSGVSVGPGSALARILPSMLAMMIPGRNPNVFRWSRFVFSVLVSPLKYGDRWLEGHPMAETIASGVWATARKSGAEGS